MPTNNLPQLNADANSIVAVQRTTLSLDSLGRFICNTFGEATDPERNRTPPFDLTAGFDAIVIGSGMYGAYCAAQLYRNGAKVLVLEAGPYLISTHYQNLPDGIGFGTGGNVSGVPGADGAVNDTTDQVWGLPWRGNQLFARQAFCVGGKSLFWGGWAPRLTNDVLDNPLPGGVGWPAPAANYLKEFYERIDLQTGVTELVVQAAGQAPVPQVRTELFNDPTNNRLTQALAPPLQNLVGQIAVFPGGDPNRPAVNTTINAIDPAPLAIQASPPVSGLFSFDKFSSLGVLAEALRNDIGRSGNSDQRRRLFLAPNVSVRTLFTEPVGGNHRVVALDLRGAVNAPLAVPQGCTVVLALSAIELTRLALQSFSGIAPLNNLMGRNLMAHVRNNATMRIRREAIGVDALEILQTSAFHIVGTASNGGRYHLQFYAGFQPTPNAEAVLYRLLPDIELAQQQLANQDEKFITVTFRGIGEMLGRTKLGAAPGGGDLPINDPSASYIDLSQEVDPLFNQRRAWVNYVQQPEDLTLFDEMDQVGFAVGLALADNDPDNIEYFGEHFNPQTQQYETRYDRNNPYAPGSSQYGKLKSERGIRDPLGTTYHDSGTLWMGDNPGTSVTDSTGRFHQVRNAWCVDQAVFPRVGSANPVPTGLVLARRSAEAIANGDLIVDEETDRFFHRPEPGFTALFKFESNPAFNRRALLPSDWKFVGDGSFARAGMVMETEGGIGILYYDKQEFTDFTLRLQWRAPTVQNNAGVYVRLPRAEAARAEEVEDSGRLIKTGYEIQIDNTGERPSNQDNFPFPFELFNPFHQTGAIYPVHPTGGFPAANQLPNPNGKPSITPIPTRALHEWNDLEVLVGGNRIRVVLNGVPVLQGGDYVDAGNAYPTGLIGLQNHFKGFRVQFRHVRIQEGAPQF